jgi:hypothetical protein
MTEGIAMTGVFVALVGLVFIFLLMGVRVVR